MRSSVQWLSLIVLTVALVTALDAVHVPAALLLGPMLASIVFAVSGSNIRLPRGFTIGAQAILGCLIAQAIDAQLMAIIGAHWMILVGFSLATLVLAAALGWWITRAGWLPGTVAIWGLSPGAASSMVLLADDFGADRRVVALMQYSRIALVALAAILVAKSIGHPSLPPPHEMSNAATSQWLTLPPAVSLFATTALAAMGVALSIFLRKAALALFIPAFAGAALQAAGWIHLSTPPLLAALAFGAVGMYVGLSFNREMLIHSLSALPKMFVAVVTMIVLCGLLSLAFCKLLPGADPLTAYLALSPGGIDAAVIIATSTNVSLPLILASQFVRLLIVIAGAPALAKWLARRMEHRHP
ncbi:AbrB family transcriptional regulator [Steroidobacter sp. S1-65]|uniref:AbrB family transcriptional regulator n=1 Tax=Steroidobacter gossypii TaxID=2805490 RepID=A0ABS1X032_9GAMM|nr:AbrB family transcriptional regulator [Steroidobacter gossypii]